uniref:Protein TOPAZ1 n=1 Tax=Zonotrichia albicollis TaxID=44394 RepID=A0A8D2M472_ZONAL
MGEPGCLPTRLRPRAELGLCSQALAVLHRSPVSWAALSPRPGPQPRKALRAPRGQHDGCAAPTKALGRGLPTRGHGRPEEPRSPPPLPGLDRAGGPADPARERERPGGCSRRSRLAAPRSRPHAAASPSPAGVAAARLFGRAAVLGRGERIGRRGQIVKGRGWEGGAGGCRQRPSSVWRGTKQNRVEDSKEKESHYSKPSTVSATDDTESKSFLCHAVTEEPGVQRRKRQHRSGKIKRLQSSSVTAAEEVMNVSAKCGAERGTNALNHCSGLFCAAGKNPLVVLQDCCYINTLVKPSASGTTNSYKLNGFFHVAHGTGELSDRICSTSRMQNERSLIKGGFSPNKEKNENEEGCVSGCLSESSKCLRGKKWNIGRKPRKKMKITEKSADMASKCKKCELQTEAAVTMSSSFSVSGLNHTFSASCGHTSDFDTEKNTQEVKTVSAWRKNSTKLLEFETGFKMTPELSAIVKGENSSNVARYAAASDCRGALAQIHDVSDHHKSKAGRNLNKVTKKLQQFTCQRTIPMTGKKVWPVESCARTSEWFLKSHRFVSEGKRLLKAAFEDSSDKSSVKAVERSAEIVNVRQLDLHTSLAEITKEITHKKIDPNIDCQDENEGDVTNRNLTLTVQNGITKQKGKNEGDVTNRKLPVTVQTGTTKQKDENEGDVTNRNLSLTVQNGTSASNTNSINFSPKGSVVKQIFSDLNLIKPLTSGNLTKFKIPLCRNKPKSKKQESVHSFESKTCSPLELLGSTSPGRQKTGEETFLVKYEQGPLPVMSDAASPASIQKKADEIDSKDFQHNGSVNLSDEMSVLPESFSTYPHPLLDGQPEPSVPDFSGSECVLKSSFPDHSWNAVDPLVGLAINGDRKSRGNFSQKVKSQNLPDVLEAYNQDVLVIDVIQDDPDLFGTSNKEELAPAHCENCPVRASCIKDTKVYIKPESPVPSENKYSVESNRQQSKLDELLTSLDVDEKVLRNYFVDIFKFKKKTKTMFPFKKYYLAFSACCNFILFQASHSVQQILDALNLPRKYCRYYFMTSRGCERTKCWFCHVPGQGDEKVKYLLASVNPKVKFNFIAFSVQIFVQYYKEVTPGIDFASEVLNDLLLSLLNNCLLPEVFQILNVIVQIKTLPAIEVLLKVFEHVASLNIRNAVPTLISTFCKLIDAGMFLELEHFDYIIKLLRQLQVSSWEMSTVLNIKSRYVFKELFSNYSCLAPSSHCKEKRDWTKLGALYLNARTGCEHFVDLQKLFLSIAEILTKDSEADRPGVPFCDFADIVMKNSQHNKADRLFIGRTGISVMYSYHKVLQWIKGRKVLDKLHELQIDFTLLKGLVGAGKSASRCQIVNKATEIFLYSGHLDGAIRVLRESEWITDAPLWPCDKMDILNRHNLLCAIVHKYLRKSLYRQAFEVLQNLPGLQKHSDIIDASQYSCLFNKLINACFENKNLGVSSSAVDFMLSKKIAIDFVLLRGLITALGRSSLWSKARTYYKNALSLGCYPELQGNLYHKLLKVPSYLSEVEMLLAIEIFLVSNASDIQSSRTTSQTLQIILKRSEETVQNNSAYHEAVERLIQAAHLSDPKLFLKHLTVNVNMEEVYRLEHSSALKWLQENMKWAEKVWLSQ